MKNILFLGLCLLSLSACDEDFFSQTVAIDPPEYEKQLVLHLDLDDQDSMVSFQLTRNFGILETVPNSQDWFVKGGQAELLKDGQPWLTLTSNWDGDSATLGGIFPAPLQAGSIYELRVSHPNFPTVSAAQVMPGDFVVDSARIKVEAVTGQFGDQFDLVDVYLKDPPGVRNFYEVTLVTRYYQLEYNPNTGQNDTVWYENPRYVEEYSDPNIQQGFGEGGLLSDQFFDGQGYKFQARLYSGGNQGLTARVRNVTEEYYKWSRSYFIKYDTGENPLVEPTSIFSNLVGGLGIFSVSKRKAVEVLEK